MNMSTSKAPLTPQSTYLLKSSHSGVIVIGGIDFHRINVGKRRIVKFSLANTNNKKFIIQSLYLQQPINESYSTSNHNGHNTSIFSIVGDFEFPITIPPTKDFESFISFAPPYPGRFTALLTITSEDYPTPKVQQITLNGEGELQSTPTQIIYTDNHIPIILETPAKTNRVLSSHSSSSSSNSNNSLGTYSGFSDGNWPTLPYFDDDVVKISGTFNESMKYSNRDHQTPPNNKNSGNQNHTPPNSSLSSTSSHTHSTKKVRWGPNVYKQQDSNGVVTPVNNENIQYHKDTQKSNIQFNHQDTYNQHSKVNGGHQNYQKPISTHIDTDYYINNIDSKFQQFEKKLSDLTKRVEESNSRFNSFVSDQSYNDNDGNSNNNNIYHKQPQPQPQYLKSTTPPPRHPTSHSNIKYHEPNSILSHQHSPQLKFSQEDIDLLDQMKPDPIQFETPKPWKKFLNKDTSGIDDSLNKISFKYSEQTPSKSQNQNRNK